MEAKGVRTVDRTSDPVHHRSVITAVGSASQTVAASVAVARVAHERIDLRLDAVRIRGSARLTARALLGGRTEPEGPDESIAAYLR